MGIKGTEASAGDSPLGAYPNDDCAHPKVIALMPTDEVLKGAVLPSAEGVYKVVNTSTTCSPAESTIRLPSLKIKLFSVGFPW